ncbi:hypothetical protein CDAR_498221 [Caerostris darwini]|uniref:Uncharacterized protein n=1 Tax=Caerostris darwini TaxID=1538125 RepID=A0AAV4U005_9ARAC|nr:hypothetical protein CDAR_498221 [Caerostris darwini]
MHLPRLQLLHLVPPSQLDGPVSQRTDEGEHEDGEADHRRQNGDHDGSGVQRHWKKRNTSIQRKGQQIQFNNVANDNSASYCKRAISVYPPTTKIRFFLCLKENKKDPSQQSLIKRNSLECKRKTD